MTDQPTTADLLARYNSLRADVGKTPLKAWKLSRTNLEQAIENILPLVQAEFDRKVAEAEAVDTPAPEIKAEHDGEANHFKLNDAGQKAVKAAREKKVKGKTKSAKARVGDIFSLADLARELKINPKVARAKARRHEKDLKPFTAGNDNRWEFLMSEKAGVTSIIKG